MNELTAQIKDWAIERKLHDADPYKQVVKLGEEYGEVCSAMAKDEQVEALELEIGDMFIGMTILTMQLGLDIEDCIVAAYGKIKNRSGEMVNGFYVKEDDLE